MRSVKENNIENYGTRTFCDRFDKPMEKDWVAEEILLQYEKMMEYNRKLIFRAYGITEDLFEIK